MSHTGNDTEVEAGGTGKTTAGLQVKKSTSGPVPGTSAGGAAAGNEQMVNQTMLLELQAPKIALWKGNGRDLLTIKQWVEAVDRIAYQRGWDNTKTASVVYDFLVDDAAKWVRNMKKGPNAQFIDRWDDLKREMVSRFSTIKTMAQKTRALGTLTQKKEESVAAFFDRIEEAMYELGEEEAARIAPDETSGQVWNRAMNLFTKAFFVSGINKDIRVEVEEKMRTQMPMRELVELAREKESLRNMNPTATAKVHAIDTEDEGTTTGEQGVLKQQAAELAALKARLNAFTAGNKKESKDRPPPPPMEKRDKAFFCYICHRWGIHLTRECKMTREEGKKIPQDQWQDPKKRPASIPFDPCYPNLTAGGTN